jgi:hypothetical protein
VLERLPLPTASTAPMFQRQNSLGSLWIGIACTLAPKTCLNLAPQAEFLTELFSVNRCSGFLDAESLLKLTGGLWGLFFLHGPRLSAKERSLFTQTKSSLLACISWHRPSQLVYFHARVHGSNMLIARILTREYCSQSLALIPCVYFWSTI